VYKGMPYKAYFKGLEEIVLAHQGRPHWAKLHTCQTEYLKSQYPHWEDFMKVRQTLDPEQKLLNPYLKELFGL